MKLRLRIVPSMLAALAYAGSAQAAFISSGVVNIDIPDNLEGISVDILTGSTGAGPLAGADINFFFDGAGISNDADGAAASPSLEFVRVGGGTLDTAANLPLGTVINASSTFASGFGGSSDHINNTFTDGVPGYLGFSLDDGGTTLFGWMEVTLTPNTGGGTIHEWGYHDQGFQATAGVPEASEALVIMCGLTGLVFGGRRRRREAAKA